MKLNQLEVEYFKSQVRQDLRKQDRKRGQLVRKFGDEADLSQVETRTNWLESLYRKLGGEVNQISNRRKEMTT